MKTVVFSHSVWIFGTSRSGKTARLVEQFARWMQDENYDQESFYTKKVESKVAIAYQKLCILIKKKEQF